MPIPWNSSLLPEALVAGLPTAVAAGAVGGFVGGALIRPAARIGLGAGHDARSRMGRLEHRAALAGLVVILAALGWALPVSSESPRSAQVHLSEARPGEAREVNGFVRISPADGLADAHFLNLTAWQGGASVVSELERVGPGAYRSAEPVPVHGSWKTLVRLHVGDSLVGLPIHLPEDRAIPAAAVAAEPVFERPFVRDVVILQRERKQGVAGWLTALAYLTVAALAAALIALVGWALLRLERGGPRPLAGRSRASRVEALEERAQSAGNVAETSGRFAATPSPR